MMKDPDKTPANTLNTTDTGDDTQRRYRYQATFAAMLSLHLLDDDSEFEEIFCEHHEDILVKKTDGTFIGIQVKTREQGGNAFKANDPVIIKALVRFIEHSIDYPGSFSRFVLATNHSFWSAAKEDHNNLSYLLKVAKGISAQGIAKVAPALSNYIDKLIEESSKVSGSCVASGQVVNALGEVVLEEKLPKFDDIESRLATLIPQFYSVGEARYDDLARAAACLIDKMLEASSLKHDSPKHAYFALCSDPSKAQMDATINGKRITKAKVASILKEALSPDVLLHAINAISVVDLPKGMKILETKMAMGNISVLNIRRMKDYKYSAERLFIEWMHKYGTNRANDRYEHMSVLVGTECQEAYDSAYREDQSFGHTMLTSVRERLRTRHGEAPTLFFNCQYEHTLGIAGILTEACEVWWSKEFDLPEDT